MSYEKRLCVLKQLKKGFSADGSPLSGAVYAERLGGELLITPKIVGLSPLREGRYALSLWVGGRTYCLELSGNESVRIPDAPSLKEGFSALLCFVRGDAEPVAHGFCGSAPSDHRLLLNAFSQKAKIPNTPPERKKAAPKEVAEEPDPFRGIAAAGDGGAAGDTDGKEEPGGKYDDEAIASSDYFGKVWDTLEDAGVDALGEGEEKAAKDGSGACADETDAVIHPFRLSGGGLTYYKEIAPRLALAMKKYPKDTTLKSVFPSSEWVKAESALLGIIYADGQPRYLCVAMKDEPPAEVKDACMFVPESPYTETEGYYIVFQDADTGEYVKVENA